MLVTKRNTLVEPLNDEFKIAGSGLLEGSKIFFALQRILLAMLKIPNHDRFYLVDALDECDSELSKLLNLIINDEFIPPLQKWLITSQSSEDIERQLRV